MDEDVDCKNTRRCVVCSKCTKQNCSTNIFKTTLPIAKELLSDFVKNVLDCSVLIVIAPEFFLCKRCFSLCTELDALQARCTEIKNLMKALFKNKKESNINGHPEENQVLQDDKCEEVETHIDDDSSLGLQIVKPSNYSFEEFNPLESQGIEDELMFLNSQLVGSEVTITNSCRAERADCDNFDKRQKISNRPSKLSTVRRNVGPQRRYTITDDKGYIYCVNRTVGENRYLRCTKYKNGCLARAILRPGARVEPQHSHSHNHRPDHRRVAVRKFTEAMIIEARDRSGRRLIDIYNEVVERYPEEAVYVSFKTARIAVKRAELAEAGY